jgi:MoaA/NifB/PqqE/SkfB family radical SAM enzyme
VDFDSEQISELLESDNLHFRKIASKALVDHFPFHSSLFFDSISKEQGRDDLVRFANQRFVSLSRGFDEASIPDTEKEYLYLGEFAGEHTLFFSKMDEYVARNKKKAPRLLNKLYALFPGIRPDLTNRYPLHMFTAGKENVKSQLMLFITGNCNLNCPYCFSNTLERKEMSLAVISSLFQWACSNNIKQLTLCGGEPALHSHFDTVLSMIGEYGFSAYFASNMLTDYSLLSHFNPAIVELVYAHLTDVVWKNHSLRKQFVKNILFTRQQGIDLVFRTNIEDGNPPVDNWFDMLSETGISRMNIALTFPSGNLKNHFIAVNSFNEYTGIIGRIIEKARINGVQLSFAKPVPICLFDKDTRRFLLSNPNFHPLCGVHHRHFTHNVCIYPDLRIRPCLGISRSSILFHKDISWQAVEDFCARTIRPLLYKPLFETCLSCFLYDRKLCQGSCLSYKNRL